MAKVLVVDDDDTFVNAVRTALKFHGYEVLCAYGGNEGMKMLKDEQNIAVLLLDLRMPGVSGEDVLKDIVKNRNVYGSVPVIIMTADRDTGKAMEMMSLGADDFIVKPLTAQEIASAVEKAIALPEAYKKVGWTEIQYNPGEGDLFHGKSEVMVSLAKELSRIAQTKSNVLILGETGTGKELIARTLHENSDRGENPFITANCFGLPTHELIYSEFWGHVSGAFDGANADREGCFRLADGGTVFLSEIDLLDGNMQDELLLFLRTNKVHPLGSETPEAINLRVIAATSKDIKRKVEEGSFLRELYDRLAGDMICVPPLRERRETTEKSNTPNDEEKEGNFLRKLYGRLVNNGDKELKHKDALPLSDDIEVLVDYAIDRYNKTKKIQLPLEGIEIEALDLLKGYNWPGNVRQLNNVLNEAASKAVLKVSNRVISAQHIRESHLFETPLPSEPLGMGTLEDLYKKMLNGDHNDARRFAERVNEILNMANGDVRKAAQIAGVTRSTMEQYLAEARDIILSM